MPAVQKFPEPLLPGQRLTREEFLRRWDALPELKNAELIDGIVYMPSPVSILHCEHDSVLIWWLTQFAIATPGCKCGNNGTWLMLESAPQPDSALRILPEYGGQSSVEGSYGLGAPELAVEICASRATYDVGPKLALYQRAGVREYLTVTLDPGEVVWRELVAGSYAPMTAGRDGILRSRVFPGFWLDGDAAMTEDGPRLQAVLNQGLASGEHVAFVRTLEARRRETAASGRP